MILEGNRAGKRAESGNQSQKESEEREWIIGKQNELLAEDPFL